MATQQDMQSIEKEMEKTDFGHLVNTNKKSILIGGALIIVMILGYSGFTAMQKSGVEKSQNQAFLTKKLVFTPYIESKIKADAFIVNLKSIQKDIVANHSLFPTLFLAVDKLTADGKGAEATEALALWAGKLSKSAPLYFYSMVKLAPMYEDLGNNKMAIETLENILGQNLDLMRDKLSLDLGRMYLSAGQKEKAKDKFNFVIGKYPNTEFSKLAKLYLGKL